MKKTATLAGIFIIILMSFILFKNKLSAEENIVTPSPISTLQPQKISETNTFMKDVGEAYMDNFGLTEIDFKKLSEARVTYIEGNFDICADDKDVQFFLSHAAKYNLKVIMPAGSGEAEWGYKCNRSSYPKYQAPSWQKAKVTQWIMKWKDHPAVYGWDISNEAGSVMPNPEFMLSTYQLQRAYRDVKKADPTRPIMIRMNGWYFYENQENPFPYGNPFGANLADIVMINAYSNVEDYYPDFVEVVLTVAKDKLLQIDPKVRLFVSFGTWNEPPLWKTPSLENLQNDIKAAQNIEGIESLGFFKYGAPESEWYLPDSKLGAPDLWEFISKL